jgi:ribonucleotide monophosphatase NagD (HAD superfamily)
MRLKVAASLDGATALDNGKSQWITGAAARTDGHAWRARACAHCRHHGADRVLQAPRALGARGAERSTLAQDAPTMKLAVLGTPHVGALLIAAGKTPQGARCRFQWYRGGASRGAVSQAIAGASAPLYHVAEADLGATLSVVVDVRLPDGSVQAMSLDELRAALGALATRSPPPFFLCANPDLVTVAGAGKPLAIMPGTLAAWYAEAAGEESVILLGKPGAGIYSAALAAAGDPSPSSVLAIGDSLEHDIAGAAGAGGVDALFVAGGIHKGDLGVGAPGEEASVDEGRLAALLAGRPASQTPAFVMPYLQA